MYHTNAELPSALRNTLPRHAQDIYREAFNHARVQFGGPGQESHAHRIAWAAVTHLYQKVEGQWVMRVDLE